MNSSVHKTYPLSPLYAVVFLGFIGYSMTLPLFTVMMLSGDPLLVDPHTSLASRSMILGILLFMYPFGQFLGSPIIGAFSDKYGRKKTLLISLSCTTLFYLCIAISLTIASLSWLLVNLFMAGFFEGNIAITQSSIADVVPKSQRNQKFGMIYFWASFAYVIGPIFGGRLADKQLVSWFSYAVPFWAMLIILVIAITWIAIHFKETHAEDRRRAIHPFKAVFNLFTVFTHKQLRPYYLRNLLIYLAAFGYFRAFPMYIVDRFHTNISTLSWFIAYVSIPIMFVNLFVLKKLSSLFSSKTLCIAGCILMGISMFIIIIPPYMHALWITLFPTTFFLAIVLPSCSSLISHVAKEEEQGSAMGNNQALQVGAEALAATFAGFIAAVSIYLPLSIFGIIGILSGFSFFWSKLSFEHS